MIYDIIIIGAGASGLAAAINAKQTDRKLNIAALDAMPKVGKKILATGNGRCNLSNLNAAADSYTNPDFVSAALNEFPPERVIEFFRSIGVLCVADGEGRVYPMSNTASSVLDALRSEAERLGVEFMCEKHVDRLEKKNGIFTVGKLVAKKVIICTGGCASASQGSDGSGFDLLKSLGHHITEVYPGLVQLTTKENTKSLKGVRAKANVSLRQGVKPIDDAKGEVLFTGFSVRAATKRATSKILTAPDVSSSPTREMRESKAKADLLQRRRRRKKVARRNMPLKAAFLSRER